MRQCLKAPLAALVAAVVGNGLNPRKWHYRATMFVSCFPDNHDCSTISKASTCAPAPLHFRSLFECVYTTTSNRGRCWCSLRYPGRPGRRRVGTASRKCVLREFGDDELCCGGSIAGEVCSSYDFSRRTAITSQGDAQSGQRVSGDGSAANDAW